MSEFYSMIDMRVALVKSERESIWSSFKNSRVLSKNEVIAKNPALESEITKAINSGNLIQSAVFSECVYAQTLANALGCLEFYDYDVNPGCISSEVERYFTDNGIKPRYIYKSKHADRVLVQAGGAGGVDCALVMNNGDKGFLIEFKEPGSKTSEPDLPKYGEDGFIYTTSKFEKDNSHFVGMLSEQIARGLNIWNIQGSNVHDFDPKNVQIAVSENYAAKKFADVICVEDENGFLTMIPANQADKWADIRGEIRPTGRNHSKVWTPIRLAKVIEGIGGTVQGGVVSVPYGNLGTSRARGGDSSVNRYKIDSIFFVRPADISITGSVASFDLSSVRQIRPTISAHMFFRNLDVNKVRLHYKVEM